MYKSIKIVLPPGNKHVGMKLWEQIKIEGHVGLCMYGSKNTIESCDLILKKLVRMRCITC